MILLGLGANLPSSFGPPRQSLERALAVLAANAVATVECSPWYGAHPVPAAQQPDFVNGVASITTSLPPGQLLEILHKVEQQFGRVPRSAPQVANAARPLDLDLLAYDDQIISEKLLVVPHPRLHERAFVLAPLCDIAPHWRHPVLGLTAYHLYQNLTNQDGIWLLATD